MTGFVVWLSVLLSPAYAETYGENASKHHTEQKQIDNRELLDMMGWKLDDPKKVVKFKISPSLPAPFSLSIRPLPGPGAKFQFTQPIKRELKIGTKLRLEIQSMTNFKTHALFVLESVTAPYERIFSEDIILTQNFYGNSVIRELVVPKTIAANRYVARLELLNAQGNIEFTGISLVTTGQDEGLFKAQAKISPDQVEHRIDRLRKGSLQVLVCDRNGKAVPNAQIIVEQTAHKFLFGGVCKDFRIEHQSRYDANFETRFLQLFNYATIPFPWDAMEERKGKINYAHQEQMIAWCAAHQLTAKGGPLIYDWDCPNWLPKDPAALAHTLRVHVSNTIGHFNSKIKVWDVIKDVSDEQTLVPNGFGYWLKHAGPEMATGKALEWAKQSNDDPNRKLLYIDSECAKNREVLNVLEKNGNLPDGIGLETTFYDYTIELADVWRLCEAYKRYNKPLHFDGVTILSGDIKSSPPWDRTVKDWLSTASGEAKQADYVEHFYSILFSHPSVESITWWDFGDRDSYMGAPAGLLRRDGSPKPAFERLRKLIHEKWWTKATLTTDRNGSCATRAFWGSYLITVKRSNGIATRTAVKFYDEQQPVKIVVD